jgi:redox-sensitive bicupin YhaK (pirin superfamily)
MGFGPLLVLNQDHIAGGGGFPTHGHRNMEIITWVQSGELIHEDSMGHRGSLGPGELQVMSAGRGVRHAEYNGSKENSLHLLQMWIQPSERETEARWEQRLSPSAEREGQFIQLVGEHEEARDGLLTIGQDARMHVALLAADINASLDLPAGRKAYLHVARGSVIWNDIQLEAGDAIAFEATRETRPLSITGSDPRCLADVILWDLP